MKYTVDLATAADDAAIRQLLADSPLPGSVVLSYEREPDYFLGCGTMGRFYQVYVARREDGELIGLGCRATRPLFVNGAVEEVGYLGQLRIGAAYQARGLLPAAFRTLRSLHADGRVDGYITTIVEQNTVAQGVLVRRPRPGFPAYREVGRIHTLALILSRRALMLPGLRQHCEISGGRPGCVEEIVAFLRQHGPQRQFFPAYEEQDFCGSPLTCGFQVEDFLVARRGGEIVGTLGLWDQSSYKQTVVHGYGGTLRRLRPLYTLGAWLAGLQPMPRPGAQLHFVYASFVCVRDDDPAVFRALLWQAYHQATRRGYAYLMLGLAEGDPLLASARRYPHIPYHSRLYTVSWDEGKGNTLHERLDGRVPYVEIASL